MKIAVLGAGAVGSTIGRLWHAAGHDVTFAARHATRPRALAAELGERAHAASVAGALAGAEVVLVAVPALAVTGALQAAGPLDGRIVIDAANSLERGVFGQQQPSLRSLADAFPRARWARAFNSLNVNVMADDNHREPPWVLFLSGDQQAKPVVAQLIRDAGFDPVDLGDIDDSQLQDPRERAVDLGCHPRRGDGACRADKVRGHRRGRSADRAIREVPRPCTGRSRVLPRPPVARGLRGRDLAGR
jgi:8-hydroxy-5-deazaflavin:NADPH oxidoreductase